MSTFDANSFLDASVTEANTKRPPLPVGDYTAIITEPVIREWVSSKDPTKSGYAADFQLEIDVPADVQEAIGIDVPTLKVKYGIMLDLNSQRGIDTAPGKNGALRRFREAIDMNKPGENFNLRSAAGRVVKVKIGHREYPEGSGELFEDVISLARV